MVHRIFFLIFFTSARCLQLVLHEWSVVRFPPATSGQSFTSFLCFDITAQLFCAKIDEIVLHLVPCCIAEIWKLVDYESPQILCERLFQIYTYNTAVVEQELKDRKNRKEPIAQAIKMRQPSMFFNCFADRNAHFCGCSQMRGTKIGRYFTKYGARGAINSIRGRLRTIGRGN